MIKKSCRSETSELQVQHNKQAPIPAKNGGKSFTSLRGNNVKSKMVYVFLREERGAGGVEWKTLPTFRYASLMNNVTGELVSGGRN